jgi:hypothetical protein
VAALWRAGFLELDGAELLGAELPEGYGVDIVGTMPPIARVRDDGSLEVGIGGLEAAIALPGIFGEPLLAQVNAIASTGLTLSGETLSVDDVVIEELHFSMDGIDLDPAQRETLEAALMRVVVTVVESLLTDALPRLPIPSLPLPPSFEVYGLPPATEVGVLDGVMSSQGQHLYLTSEFGVQ